MDLVLTHTVKVMNGMKKSDNSLKILKQTSKFKKYDELKSSLEKEFSIQIETIGFIIPGHGWKGKQQLLETDADISEMYVLYKKRQEILLWCHTHVSTTDVSRKC